MNKHQITHPDGTISTRNSKTRTYTHCVEVKDSRGYGVVGWCSRADLAPKLLNQWAARFPEHAVIREVDSI